MPGGYIETSANQRLEGTVLVADCTKKDGSTVESRLDLNDLIANEDGNLVWRQGGNFAASCNNITLVYDGAFLVCDAINKDEKSVTSRLALNDRIVNQDGELAYED